METRLMHRHNFLMLKHAACCFLNDACMLQHDFSCYGMSFQNSPSRSFGVVFSFLFFRFFYSDITYKIKITCKNSQNSDKT